LVAVEIDAQGGTSRESALIRIASQVERSWLEEDTPGVREVPRLRFDRERAVVESVLEVRYFDLLLEERPLAKPNQEEVARVLEDAARADLDRALPITDAFEQLLLRLELAESAKMLPGVDIGRDRDVRLWLLTDLSMGRRSFAELRAVDLASALLDRLPPDARRALDRLAPERIEVPSGRSVALRYERDGPPALSVRLQEVFGWTTTPRVGGGRVPVKMELLAPNMRPVQVTQDLESFWTNTYAEVRNELRRRYPKHQWPEDPRQGNPKLKPGRRR
jgi:ATP-dependent helicase HrpB